MQSQIGKFFGQEVKLPNERLPFFMIVFMGILAIGSVLYWRHHAILAIEAGLNHNTLHPRVESVQMQSNNYQLEVIESSPVIK